MFAQKEDTAVTLDCKVECRENHYSIVGTFQIPISVALRQTPSARTRMTFLPSR